MLNDELLVSLSLNEIWLKWCQWYWLTYRFYEYMRIFNRSQYSRNGDFFQDKEMTLNCIINLFLFLKLTEYFCDNSKKFQKQRLVNLYTTNILMWWEINHVWIQIVYSGYEDSILSVTSITGFNSNVHFCI